MPLGSQHNNHNLKSLFKKNKDFVDKNFEYWIKNKGINISEIKVFLRERANYTDNLILNYWNELNLSNEKDLSLFAVGGYGRKELHPHSDIDLLVLYRKKLKPANKRRIEKFVSLLWDMGLEVGHSVRSVYEENKIASSDVQVLTNLLESRFLGGDKNMTVEAKKILESKQLWKEDAFFEAKLEEQMEKKE